MLVDLCRFRYLLTSTLCTSTLRTRDGIRSKGHRGRRVHKLGARGEHCVWVRLCGVLPQPHRKLAQQRARLGAPSRELHQPRSHLGQERLHYPTKAQGQLLLVRALAAPRGDRSRHLSRRCRRRLLGGGGDTVGSDRRRLGRLERLLRAGGDVGLKVGDWTECELLADSIHAVLNLLDEPQHLGQRHLNRQPHGAQLDLQLLKGDPRGRARVLQQRRLAFRGLDSASLFEPVEAHATRPSPRRVLVEHVAVA